MHTQRGRLLVLRRPRGMCATVLDVWPMYEGKSGCPFDLRRGLLASKTATVANATALSPFILSTGAAWNVLPFDFLVGERPIFHVLEEAVLWVNRQRHIGLARD